MTRGGQVTAVLGPTNTGKTHLAVERMLASPTGMIGLPLRLLAREVYDRVRAKVGEAAVALVTGEEKIVPAKPRFWVSTVEAMPDVEVSFLAIDEVQLAADFERGHVFTDRILSRRGRDETLLLGAATMRGALEGLVPGLNFVTRPRFSNLTWAGQRKLSRLPPRSAIVAFSADTVYALAELVRRQRGGAAVVLGALSPRTRNAQVALYQSGDVDYLVATDAIGMGLNMDVDHVAFAAARKFDGFQHRNLSPAELAQIAGRAGRFLQDGTFGVTGEAQPFDQETIERLEGHRFDPVRVVQWRSRDLDFSSLEALKDSLAAFPAHPRLTRAQASADVDALEHVSRDGEVAGLAASPAAVERLWEVCQIPDYRNISTAEHAGIVARVFSFLMAPGGRIPADWFARQLDYCNRADGNIDTLSTRIAHVRTWTFVANRADWLDDPLHWQGRAREIEDRLSDALHHQLTQRFIDRRTSVLMRRLRQKEAIMSSVEDDGAITVEGEFVGRIRGLTFVSEVPAGGEGKTLKAAALKVVAQELAGRAQSIAACPDPDLGLARSGDILWQGAPVGRLAAGPSPLKPRVLLKADAELAGPEREAVQARLEKFIERHVAGLLGPLVGLAQSEDLGGMTRGIAFRLVENMGVIARSDVAAELKDLAQEERAKLRRHGVRFGAFHLFVPLLLKPAASELRLLLWSLAHAAGGGAGLDPLPALPGQGLTSVAIDQAIPPEFYQTAGFHPCGRRAVRIDMLERLGDLIRERVFWKPQAPDATRPAGSVEGGGFTVIPDMMSLVGCSGEEFAEILKSLGFRVQRRPLPPAPPPSASPIAPAAEAAEGETGAPEASATPAEPPAPVASEAPAEPALPVAAEAAAEPQMLEVWWPRDTGPFRRSSEAKGRKGRRPRGEAKPSGEEGMPIAAKGMRHSTHTTGKEGRRSTRPPADRAPAKERAPLIDKDSPFAVLGELRSQLLARAKRGG